MVLAYRLGCKHLPAYVSKFSRKDHATLPQLFACIVLRQFYNLSYRRAEALLADSRDLREAIGMKVCPDHNTLCDAFGTLAKIETFAPMLDELATAFEAAGLLELDAKPVAVDSTHFESHHVSRHFAERRKRSNDRAEKRAAGKAGKSRRKPSKSTPSKTRGRTVANLPKLGIMVACAAHLILSAWAGTGMGSDHPHFDTLARHARRRVGVKTIVADAGYDSEKHHELARLDLNCMAYIPPLIGRPGDPTQPFRAEMKSVWDTPAARQAYGQRWQAETVNSMIKRNYGSALRARTPERREREMLLKVMTHNIAVQL
jgi:hypothetical protein